MPLQLARSPFYSSFFLAIALSKRRQGLGLTRKNDKVRGKRYFIAGGHFPDESGS